MYINKYVEAFLIILTRVIAVCTPCSTSAAGAGTGDAAPGAGKAWPAWEGGANLRKDGSFLAF